MCMDIDFDLAKLWSHDTKLLVERKTLFYNKINIQLKTAKMPVVRLHIAIIIRRRID